MHFSGKEKRAQRLDSLLFTGGPILIHALRMERDKDILEMLGYQFYFNSRTRVRCDFGKKVGGLTCPVLIRTPCEVRHLDCQGNRICQISIRAPVQGATRDVSYADGSFSVLIRAPAQGATFRAAFFYGTGSDFDSRTQVGCDLLRESRGNCRVYISIRASVGGTALQLMQ